MIRDDKREIRMDRSPTNPNAPIAGHREAFRTFVNRTSRTLFGLVLVVLAPAVSGCSGAPVSPSPVVPVVDIPVPEQPPAATCVSPETFYGCTYVRREARLTGRVYEMTPAGPVGIAGASVYCEACGLQTHTWATADANGFYSFPGDLASGGGVWLSPGFLTAIGVEHRGYQDPPGLPPLRGPLFHVPSGSGWREVLIDGDTRFDIQLARR